MNLQNEFLLIALVAGLPALAGTIAAQIITRYQQAQLRREILQSRTSIDERKLLPAAQPRQLPAAPDESEVHG